MRYRLLAVAILSSTLAATAAFAQSGGSGDAHPGQRWQQRFQQHLGLTDDQMKAVTEIRERQRTAARQVWQSLATAQGELRQLALRGADDATLQAKMTQIEQLHGQLLQLRVAALREIAPLLNEEQRDKLAQMGPGRGHHRRAPATPQS